MALDIWKDPTKIPDMLKAMPDPPEDGDVFGFLGGMCLGAVQAAVDHGFLAPDQLKGTLKATFDLVVLGYKLGRLEA